MAELAVAGKPHDDQKWGGSMRKAGYVTLFYALSFLPAVVASAQTTDRPAVEVFMGYAYLRANPLAHQFAAAPENGWEASFMANVNAWLAVVGDATGRYGSRIATGPVVGPPAFKGTTYPYVSSFTAGPQVTLRANRFAPFAHALFGVAREHTGLNGVDFTSPQTDSGFATLLGGGLDFIVTRRLKVRAIEVDYLRADVFNQTQNNAGISSGITFGFGTH